jgi:MoaA/NifB/PqqE/SkfB family radical SAM enzyme
VVVDLYSLPGAETLFPDATGRKTWKAYWNFLVSLHEKRGTKGKVRSKPYVLYLDSVSYCNLRCPFCPTGARTSDRKPSRLSVGNFEHLIDHIGPYLFDLRFYNWGEPLLNKDLPQMIKYAKKHHLMVSISTNLSVPLEPETVKEIVDSGLDFMLCSIDGVSQETYQKYRVGGNFECVINNVRMIQKTKRESDRSTPYVVWQFLVFRHNEKDIEAARTMADELGIPLYLERPYIMDHANPKEWISTIPEYGGEVIVRSLKPIRSTMVLRNGKLSNFPVSSEPCSWLWSAMAISPNGSISPCCGVDNEANDFGSIRNSEDDQWNASVIDQVWNNRSYQNARALFGENAQDNHVICNCCPIPDAQQYPRYQDELIFSQLLSKSLFLVRSLLKMYVRRVDRVLFTRVAGLSAPVQLYPVSETTHLALERDQVELRWKDVVGARFYMPEVWSNLQLIWRLWPTETHVRIPSSVFQAGRKYRWRIYAANDDGYGPSSAFSEFAVK